MLLLLLMAVHVSLTRRPLTVSRPKYSMHLKILHVMFWKGSGATAVVSTACSTDARSSPAQVQAIGEASRSAHVGFSANILSPLCAYIQASHSNR
jgi:hypothetical protein